MHAVAWNATTPYRPCLYRMKMCAAGRLAILNSGHTQACTQQPLALLSQLSGCQLFRHSALRVRLSRTHTSHDERTRTAFSLQLYHVLQLSRLSTQAAGRQPCRSTAGLIRYGNGTVSRGLTRSSKPD